MKTKVRKLINKLWMKFRESNEETQLCIGGATIFILGFFLISAILVATASPDKIDGITFLSYNIEKGSNYDTGKLQYTVVCNNSQLNGFNIEYYVYDNDKLLNKDIKPEQHISKVNTDENFSINGYSSEYRDKTVTSIIVKIVKDDKVLFSEKFDVEPHTFVYTSSASNTSSSTSVSSASSGLKANTVSMTVNDDSSVTYNGYAIIGDYKWTYTNYRIYKDGTTSGTANIAKV
ncbi:MAG: hypothetical protein LBT10_09160 [Methanobrevibacter sp.]|jgi:hypothetical protein|nr:hypothetical protein [Methanobrevibacter sp.]